MLQVVLPYLFALVVAAEPPRSPEGDAKPRADAEATPAKKDGASTDKPSSDDKAPAKSAGPSWTAAELRTYFTQIPQSEGAPTVEEKDSFLANVAGAAYRVPRQPNEATEVYSKRIVRKRDPNHPNVKKGQWTLAAMRLFYEDASKRADSLARFERDKNARVFFEAKAKEAKQVAEAIASMIEIVVEGLEGFLAPLPVADGGEPEPYGCEATVKGGAIVVENLERTRFVNDAPPENAIRTARGALKELFAAQKQYNVSANMLGMYEPVWRKNLGNLRVVIPGALPTIYLNELVLGAVEAEMHTVQIMCMTQKGELRSLKVSVQKPKPTKGKATAKGKKPAPAPTEVSCASDLPMQKCVDRIAEAKKAGPVVYLVK